jgi:hypothetical protein
MSSNYNYSQLHGIIEKQYMQSKSKNGEFNFDFDYNNWFLEESLKFGKGYIKPSNYLKNVVNKISETSTPLHNINIDKPLYLHI